MTSASTRTVSLELELLRAEGDLDAPPPPGPVAYRARGAGGEHRLCTLRWGPELTRRLGAWATGRGDAEDAAALRGVLGALLEPSGWLDEAGPALEAAATGGAPVLLRVGLVGVELWALPWELLPAGRLGVPIGRVPGVQIALHEPGQVATAAPAPRAPGGRVCGVGSGRGSALLGRGELPVGARAVLEAHPGLEAVGAGAEALLWDTGTRPVGAAELGGVARVQTASTRLVLLSSGLNDPGLPALARALHRAGVEAVGVCRAALSEPTLERVWAAVVAVLAEGGSAAGAIGAAREALLAEGAEGAAVGTWLVGKPEARPVVRSPYPGLRAFEAADAGFFQGRKDEIADALARLDTLARQGRHRLLTLVGPPGAGRLSLALAGIGPALAHRRPGQVTVRVRPGAAPLQALADALELAFGIPEIHPDPMLVRGVLVERGVPVLLVLEALEECAALATPDAAAGFGALLGALTGDPGLDLIALVTLRADRTALARALVLDPGRGLRLDALAAGVGEQAPHRLPVLPLLPAELRRAIEGPAARAGLELEPGLAAQLLAEIEGLPSPMPLLALTLERLWARREGTRLTLAAYAALGGVSGVLATEAAQTLAALPPAAQAWARALLVRLVKVGGPGEPLDLRRRVPRAELAPPERPAPAVRAHSARALEDPRSLRRWEPVPVWLPLGPLGLVQLRLPGVLRRRLVREAAPEAATLQPAVDAAEAFAQAEQALLDAGLLVALGEGEGAALELSHDALLSAWPQLVSWVEEERPTLRELALARGWVEEWREAGALLDPGRGVRVLTLLRALPPGSAPELVELVEASAARVLRSALWRVVRRGLLVAFSLLAAGGVLAAVFVRSVLGEEHDRARARVLLFTAERADVTVQERAWLLLESLHAVGAAGPGGDGEVATRWERAAVRLMSEIELEELVVGEGAPQQVGEVQVTDLGQQLPAEAREAAGVRLSLQGARGAAWWPGGPGVWLLRTHSGRLEGRLPSTAPLTGVCWLDEALVTADAAGTLSWWGRDPATQAFTVLRGSQRAPAGAWALACSPTGDVVATGGEDGASLWARGQPEPVAQLGAEPVHSLTFAPDGQTLALGTGAGQVVLVGRDGAERGRLAGPSSVEETWAVGALAWGPAGLAWSSAKEGFVSPDPLGSAEVIALQLAGEGAQGFDTGLLEEPELPELPDSGLGLGDDLPGSQALLERTVPPPPEPVWDDLVLAWNQDGHLVIEGSGELSLASGEPEQLRPLPEGSGPPVVDALGRLYLGLRAAPTLASPLLRAAPRAEGFLPWDVAWRPGTSGFAAWHEAELVWWSSLSTAPTRWEPPVKRAEVTALQGAWSLDGRALLWSTGAAAARWEPEQPQGLTWALPEGLTPIACVWSPDGAWMLWWAAEGVWVQAAQEGAPLLPLAGAPDGVRDWSWSARGDRLTLVGEEGLYRWQAGAWDQAPQPQPQDGVLLHLGEAAGGEAALVVRADPRPRLLTDQVPAVLPLSGTRPGEDPDDPAGGLGWSWTDDRGELLVWTPQGTALHWFPGTGLRLPGNTLLMPGVGAHRFSTDPVQEPSWLVTDPGCPYLAMAGDGQLCLAERGRWEFDRCAPLEVGSLDVGSEGVLVSDGLDVGVFSWPTRAQLAEELTLLAAEPSDARKEALLGAAAHRPGLRAALRTWWRAWRRS